MDKNWVVLSQILMLQLDDWQPVKVLNWLNDRQWDLKTMLKEHCVSWAVYIIWGWSNIPILSFRKITRCVCISWRIRYKLNHKNIPRRLKTCINNRKRWGEGLVNSVHTICNWYDITGLSCHINRVKFKKGFSG